MSAIVLRGDARSLPLPDGCVDLIVTSPPYYQLRDYRDADGSLAGQIGSEETPAEYLAALWDCTREWMRVLKPGGSLFVNLGDKYSQRVQVRRSSHQPGIFPGKFPEFGETWAERASSGATRMPHQNVMPSGGSVPEKSLLLLPERYRIGCVDHLGLIARETVIWRKLNGLPESVRDRCRRAHEDIVHLVKQPVYYSAVDEIREPHAEVSIKRAMPHRSPPGRRPASIYNGQPGQTLRLDQANNPLGKLPDSVWDIPSQPLVVPDHLGLDHFAAFPCDLPRRIILGWSPPGICVECGEGRRPVGGKSANGRPRKGAADGGRGARGLPGYEDIARTPWAEDVVRVITGYACACTPYTDHAGTGKTTQRRSHNSDQPEHHPQGTYGQKQAGEYERVGPWCEYHLDRWTPAPTRSALVVDPFGGTGTTALVADILGRNAITFDLSADYCRLATWRCSDPGERARARGVPKPPPVPDGQGELDLFGKPA